MVIVAKPIPRRPRQRAVLRHVAGRLAGARSAARPLFGGEARARRASPHRIQIRCGVSVPPLRLAPKVGGWPGAQVRLKGRRVARILPRTKLRLRPSGRGIFAGTAPDTSTNARRRKSEATRDRAEHPGAAGRCAGARCRGLRRYSTESGAAPRVRRAAEGTCRRCRRRPAPSSSTAGRAIRTSSSRPICRGRVARASRRRRWRGRSGCSSSADWKAGDNKVAYQDCDDSTAQAAKWDSGKCSTNANAYAQNESVVGVIGTFNSGCAAIEAPVLNQAPGGGVLMVSPANTYGCLTEPCAGNEPEKYYPTGKRNYMRVAPSDPNQGAVEAQLMKEMGVKRLYILNDKEAYGLGVAKNTRARRRRPASRSSASRPTTRAPRASRPCSRRSRARTRTPSSSAAWWTRTAAS